MIEVRIKLEYSWKYGNWSLGVQSDERIIVNAEIWTYWIHTWALVGDISIMHHFSTELLSTSNSTLIPIFKLQLPICPWISIFHPTIIIKQPSHDHWSTCPIQMTSSLYSRTPLKFRWKTSPSPNIPSSWKSPYNHSSLLNQPFDVSSAPSWHSLLFLSLHPWHPLWFPSLHWMISPLLLSFLLTHYFLHIYDPRDHIIGTLQ